MNEKYKDSNPTRTLGLQQGLSNQDELRLRFKKYYLQYNKLKKKLMASGMPGYKTLKYMPIYPLEFNDLRCGAKTRAGTPCKMKSIYYSGRCKLHGGLSTGPITEKGKAKVAKNGLKMKVGKQTP